MKNSLKTIIYSCTIFIFATHAHAATFDTCQKSTLHDTAWYTENTRILYQNNFKKSESEPFKLLPSDVAIIHQGKGKIFNSDPSSFHLSPDEKSLTLGTVRSMGVIEYECIIQTKDKNIWYVSHDKGGIKSYNMNEDKE